MDLESALVILGTARDESNTLESLKKSSQLTNFKLIELHKLNLLPYSYTEPPKDDFLYVAEKMLEHHRIVFATPVYWYAMSGVLKIFFDRLTDLISTSKSIGRSLAGKQVTLFATGTDRELPDGFEIPFRRTCEYFDMKYQGAIYICTKESSLSDGFLFRPAKPEEMDTIFMMGFDVWSESSTAQQYLEECQSSEKYKRGKWFVLENTEKQPVCSLITYNFDNEKIAIGSIATQPDLRGKGLASLLVKKFLDSVTASSEKMIFLYSDISPKLYERLGFMALPEQLQQYQTSTCMVWGDGLNKIERRADFQPPKYF